MCQFCISHGDGKRWYLNAAVYAEELLEDAHRVKYIQDFIPNVSGNAARWLRMMDRGRRISPAATKLIAKIKSRQMKKIHFGQVIPLEDVKSVMGIVGQIVRLPCVCRDVLLQKEEAVCYLLSASPDKLGFKEILGKREESAPFVAGMENVSPAQALSEMSNLEENGKIHTVWTFISPFIGAVCNCDHDGCLAMNFSRRGLTLYFPGEGRAAVETEKCTACGNCADICPFSALSVNDGCASVASKICQGCGICRRACATGAITLRPIIEVYPP